MTPLTPETANTAARTPYAAPPFAPTTAQEGLIHATVLLTQRGEVEVQDLTPGDRVISRNAGLARLTGILQRHVMVDVVAVAAGSLGDTRPEQDMLLPHDQQILIRDWRAQALFGKPRALARARDLVDGEFILDIGPSRQRVYHLQFDSPQIIYAGGLELACGDWPRAALRPAA